MKQKQINRTIEADVGYLISEHKRGENKQKQILRVVDLIKELQKQKNITDFNKSFLRNLLIDFSNLSDRSRQRKVNELLSYSKSQKQRTIKKRFLVGEPHTEFKIKGELTTSKRHPINRVWVERNELSLFYSFL